METWNLRRKKYATLFQGPLRQRWVSDKQNIHAPRLCFFFGRCCRVFTSRELCISKRLWGLILTWMFPKIVVPQNGWFIMENPIKMMIWGYHYFRKHPHFGPSALRSSWSKLSWSRCCACCMREAKAKAVNGAAKVGHTFVRCQIWRELSMYRST